MPRQFNFTGGRTRDLLGGGNIPQSILLQRLLQGRGNNAPIDSTASLGVNLGAEAIKALTLRKLRQQAEDRENASGENLEQAFALRDRQIGNLVPPPVDNGSITPLAANLGGAPLSQQLTATPRDSVQGQGIQEVGETRQVIPGQLPPARLTPQNAAIGRGEEQRLRFLQNQGPNRLSPPQAPQLPPLQRAPTQEEVGRTLFGNKDNRPIGANILSQALAGRQADAQRKAEQQFQFDKLAAQLGAGAQQGALNRGNQREIAGLNRDAATARANRPRTGVDIPLPQNVLDQKIDIAKAGAQILNPLEKAKFDKLNQEQKSFIVKSKGALTQFETKTQTVTGSIDNAINLIEKGGPLGVGTAGLANLLSNLPESDARTLNNTLDTVRANVGFDNLQQMRDNSPTGGALGQVSENENKLLQAISGSLDPQQDPKVLVKNLQNIKSLYQNVLKEKKGAFNDTFDMPEGQNRRSTDRNRRSSDEAGSGDVDQELLKFMTPEERALFK